MTTLHEAISTQTDDACQSSSNGLPRIIYIAYRPETPDVEVDWHAPFITALKQERGSIVKAAQVAGIDIVTVYHHFELFPDLKRTTYNLRLAIEEEETREVMEAAYQAATGKIVTLSGQTKKARPNLRAMKILLDHSQRLTRPSRHKDSAASVAEILAHPEKFTSEEIDRAVKKLEREELQSAPTAES